MIETIIALTIAAVITAVALYCLKKKKSADPTEGNTPTGTENAKAGKDYTRRDYHEKPNIEA